MKIAIAGWHFHPPLLQTIEASGYPALIIGHRRKETHGLPWEPSRTGKGLEFACFQQYLMDYWDGESDILFMQDDGELTVAALHEACALEKKSEIDHAWIFRDEYEEFVNGGMSGRAFWCRASLLHRLKSEGGFVVDWENEKSTGQRGNFAVGMLNYRLKPDSRSNWIAIIPEFHMARRGWIANQSYQYKRLSEGMVTPEVA